MNKFMKLVFKRIGKTINKNFVGPFATVKIKDYQILSVSSNSVLRNKDPTAHAKVAIRESRKMYFIYYMFSMSDVY